jgi:predicted extracellular nuclease
MKRVIALFGSIFLASACRMTYITDIEAPREPMLFFSEYIEGLSYNKALEIFNPSSSSVRMGEYEIWIYYNGSITPLHKVNLDDFLLAPKSVYVVGHSNIENPDTCNQLSGLISFNGNDAIELRKSDLVIDSFGRIGDAIDYWSDNGISTMNTTLRRKITILHGDSVSTDAFNPSEEWEPFGTNNMVGLGTY